MSCGRPITVLVLAMMLFAAEPLRAQDGTLQTIRDDVRQGAPPNPPAPPARPAEPDPDNNDPLKWPTLDIWAAGLWGVGMAVSLPIWGPIELLGDNYGDPASFAGFPYDDTAGYLSPGRVTIDRGICGGRTWAGRFDVEYVEAFDQTERIGGHLLIETTSRLGLDTRAQYLEERLSGGRHDQLWLGDCNLTFRFAQASWAEFRTGLGFNWLADSCGTDAGFNFIYGADFFFNKPWVASTTLDAGTLGHAALFRFQATAGVMLNRFELYTGYEYTDIERTHWNGLIGGLRVWF